MAPERGDLSGSWAHAEPVIWRRSLGQVVILPLLSDEPIIITGAGVALWEFLAEPREFRAVVERLAELYHVPAERVDREITDVWGELVRVEALRRLP